MPRLDSKTTILMRKIHRWGGLLIAAFVIFYCITGILLNHRKFFDYFNSKERMQYSVSVPEMKSINSLIDSYRGVIERSDDPTVIRIRGDKTIELLYGSHGKTTYIITPEKGLMVKVEKFPDQPLHWLNRLHKAAMTSQSWILLTDFISALIIVITLTGLIILRYRPLDCIMVFGGVAVLFAGALLS